MIDITKCHGTDCHKKDICYRHRAISDHMQYYFNESPIKDGKCEYFMEIRKGDKLEVIK